VTDDAVLTGFQLADSFLPVGSYSASYGLEQFVQSGRVEDGADLERLLATYLRRQVGPGDLVALRTAHRAGRAGDVDALVAADERLHAVTLPAEFRKSATRAGERLCDLRLETRGSDLLAAYVDRDPPGQYAVVLGAVAATDDIGKRRACLLYCYSFLSDMLGAAQRLLSLGHTEVQRIVEETKPVVTDAVEAGADRTLEGMAPFAPLVEVQSAAHERARRRLFVS
jgi:urease accessory protein